MKSLSKTMVRLTALCGIASITGLPAFGGEGPDVFVPIKDSTASDPAGFQLMIVCIGLLLMVVLSIFTVTVIYLVKGNKKAPQGRHGSPGM